MSFAKIMACLILTVLMLSAAPLKPDISTENIAIMFLAYFIALLVVAYNPKDPQ